MTTTRVLLVSRETSWGLIEGDFRSGSSDGRGAHEHVLDY